MITAFKKRLVVTVLILGVTGVFGAPRGLALDSSFPDVKSDNLHVAAIEYLKNKGIISGYPDGTFKPEQTINRAEALKVIFLARQKLVLPAASVTKNITFPDVKKTDWFYNYVLDAFNLGIVEGYSDGTFKPANQITTGESLKVVLTSLVRNYQNPQVTKDPFTDVKTFDWYAPYASFALNKQFIQPFDDGSYGPTRQISRAEFAELVYRVEFSEENKLEKFPLNQDWSYCNNYQQAYKIKYPPGWTKLLAGDQMIFWKKDLANSQISFARIYPNSAVVIIAVDKNTQQLDLARYLDTLEYGTGANKQVITLNGLPYALIYIEQSGLQDSYFQLPNGQILAIYAQIGDGIIGYFLKEEVRYMIGSIRESLTASADSKENCLSSLSTTITSSSTSPNDLLKAEILKKVLVEGQSVTALNLLDDEILIDTDSIGIGTGPVDYYYTAKLDQTLKVDRNSSTLLAVKSSKTSAF